MSEANIQECDDCVAPAEAFSVVASETRLAILEALWEADDRPVRFSELRRTVGMRDSAQFNYHLDKLTPHFIHQEDEDGYDLRHAGKKVVRAVLAGEFNETPTVEPFEVQGSCADCGGDLFATYADEMLSIECVDCGSLHGHYSFPPGGLADRTREEVARAFDQRVRHLHCLAADGVCPECGGPMSTRIRRDDASPLDLDVYVDHTCGRCDHHLFSSVGLSLLDQSDVVTAHRAHGVDLNSRPYWTLQWCVSDDHTEVLSADPWRVRVTIPLSAVAESDPDDGAGYPSVLGGDDHPPGTIHVTVDGDLQVTDIAVEDD